MIFSELYGAYYNAVAAILAEAAVHPVSDEKMEMIIKNMLFRKVCGRFQMRSKAGGNC